MVQTDDVSSSGRRCQTASRKAADGTPWSLSVEVGDIVKLTPEAIRKFDTDRIALVVERFNALICWVVWADTNERQKVNSQYFEVINAAG